MQDPEYSEDRGKPKWALFELIMQRKKTQGINILYRKELSKFNKELNEDLRMDENDITQMLLFFHRVGNILYFDKDNVTEIIILDIGWFVNAFHCLEKNTDKKYKYFQKSGELKDDELVAVWEKEEKGNEYLRYKESIISYMEHLGLLAKCHKNSAGFEGETRLYYVPSMNKRRFNKTDGGKTKSSILCFQFHRNGQLPFYLFPCVVVKCMEIAKWSISKENEQYCLYENAACFSFQRYTIVVCLCMFQFQVQVWLSGDEGCIESDDLREIKQSVNEKLKQFEKCTYDIGYKCQKGALNSKNDRSFIAEEEFFETKPICNKCEDGFEHDVDKRICWV